MYSYIIEMIHVGMFAKYVCQPLAPPLIYRTEELGKQRALF